MEDSTDLLDRARRDDPVAFERLVDGHRRELLMHCYRMLGGLRDAEDALRETLLAARRGLAGFEDRAALRGGLFRIATHACLRAIAHRPGDRGRLRSPDRGPARNGNADLGAPVDGPVWLEPLPEELLDRLPAGTYEDPAAGYQRREGIELAFVAALQHLPGSRRAVLIMRDVLGFSSAEVAGALDTTETSVHSELRRARRTVDIRLPATSQRIELGALGADGRSTLVERFVTAVERGDAAGLLGLLAEDARLTLPPLPAWFAGRDEIGRFLATRMVGTPWRPRPVRANNQLGFACYQGGPDGRCPLAAVTLISVHAGLITEIAVFLDPEVYRRFPVPAQL